MLLENLVKEKIVIQALGDPEKVLSPLKVNRAKPAVPQESDEIFKLPKLKELEDDSAETEECPKQSYDFNIHKVISILIGFLDSVSIICFYYHFKIDIKSKHFLSLPADVRHEILTDLKETRKQNSWGRIRELPVDSDDFSSYQMKRLLKRRNVQVGIEEAEKEMGGKSWSLSELENMLSEDGILQLDADRGQRIASNANSRFIYVRDIANAIDQANASKKKPIEDQKVQESGDPADGEDLDLQRAIQLSLTAGCEETEVDPYAKMQLNRDQKQKFKSTIQQSHGLVRGFMMEYGEMNTEDLKDMVESTQIDLANTSDASFIGNEFNLSDTQISKPDTPDKSAQNFPGISSSENQVNVANGTNQQIEIIVDPVKYAPEDDLFADVFEQTNQSNETVESVVPDIEVASISSDDTETYEVPSQSMLFDESENHQDATVSNSAAAATNVEYDSCHDIEEKPSVVDKQQSPASTKDENSNEFVQISDDEEIFIESEVQETTKPIEITPTKTLFMPIEDQQPCTSKSLTENEKQNQEQARYRDIINTELEEKSLEELQNELKIQKESLSLERNKLERVGASITTSMNEDCKQLLRLFGIPYIESPMEAEAQCAFLNQVEMTDGVITDDSDIWLFGGKTIYKNFFLQKKVVMEFKQESIEEKFHLDRNKMIQLAMLCGSDYTIGVKNVGAVTALEILAAFPPTPEDSTSTNQHQSVVSSLRKFREWLVNGKNSGTFAKTSLRSKLKNIELSENFPNIEIARAYLEPTIDTSTDNFTWGMPEKESLIEYAKTKLGWTRLKTEELLDPVMKKMSEKKQSTIKDYFKLQMSKKEKDTSKLSKRVQKAIENMENIPMDEESSVADEDEKPKAKPSKSRKKEITKEMLSNGIKQVTVKSEDEIIISSDEDCGGPSTSKAAMKPVKAVKVEASSSKQPAKKAVKKLKNPPTKADIEEDDEDSLFVSPPKNRKIRIPDTKQVIPQREKDREESEAAKQKAIEIFKNSKLKKK